MTNNNDIRNATSAAESLAKIAGYFIRTQHVQGYWWAELESNSTMEAEYIMMTQWVGSEEGERIAQIAEDLRRRQIPDGSWNMYHGGPGDLSTTIECYFALRLAGTLQHEECMIRAKQFIIRQGGIPKARVFTKIWLALFGHWEWNAIPIMPPELILIPKWAPFNLYKFASWARATIVPMLILTTQQPIRRLARGVTLAELAGEPDDNVNTESRRLDEKKSKLEKLFGFADQLIRQLERLPWKPFRKTAIHRAEHWMLQHQEADGSWAGIQPPWVYSLIALVHLGWQMNNPVIQKGLAGFRKDWSKYSDDGQALRVQACLSPAWDTALTTIGLLDAGVPETDQAIQRALRWFFTQEIRTPGDWTISSPELIPSGWAFEFENRMYPDIDDTAIVVMSLARSHMSNPAEERARKETLTRAVSWVIGMQSKNGGWAAFDKDNDSSYLAKIPFGDFGELIDPPSVDVTAHVIEMFGRLGYSRNNPVVKRGLNYIWENQERDGSWFGRWGVNYIYGIGAVLPALESVGEDMQQPRIRSAVAWLLNRQNHDGGWGEHCASYVDPSLAGTGDSTASQTSWALIGLLAAGERRAPSVTHGIQYLIRTQQMDGSWEEPQFTGCGFPGYGAGRIPKKRNGAPASQRQGRELGAGFMIKYHFYRNYFPLWALGRYIRDDKDG